MAPQSETEKEIAAIWAELLSLRKVSVRADFFASGGHSLLATQVVNRIVNSLGVRLDMRQFFNHPTIEGLANCVENARLAAGSLGNVPAGHGGERESGEI